MAAPLNPVRTNEEIRQSMGAYLPKYYDGSRIVGNILDVEGSEMAEFNAETADVLAQFYVDTATWGLANWERICGITTDTTKPIDQRRSVIKSKLRGVGTVTAAMIKNVAEAYDNGTVEVTGYDKNILPPFNSGWTLYNKATAKADFFGKIAGSTTENANIAKRTSGGASGSTTLLAPSGIPTEFDAGRYSAITVLDGNVTLHSNTNNGAIAQMSFSYDLISILERKYGTSLGADLAAKVAWLKANVTKLTGNWHGWGSSVGGYKANFTYWSGSAWLSPSTNTASSVSKLSAFFTSSENPTRIDANGFVHFLAYADAAAAVANPTVTPTLSASGSGSGLAAGTYYVNYVWLISGVGRSLPSPEQSITITTGQNIVVTVPAMPFGVNLTEIYMSTTTNTETFQGQTSTGTYTRSTALSAGGALPTVNTAIVASTINTDYVELLIEANVIAGKTVSDAQIDVSNPYKLVLDANIANEASYINVLCGSSRNYTLSYASGSLGYSISFYDSSDVFISSVSGGALLSSGSTFTTPPNAAKIRVTAQNTVGGSFAFTNPQLQLGPATPFEPKKTYTVGITFVSKNGIPANLTDIQNALREIIPAHLAIEFVFSFMTWSTFDPKGFTWGTLSTANYTWDQLEKLT